MQTTIQSPNSLPGGNETIAAAVQPYIDRGEVAGAVLLVANAEGILSVDALGYADIATRKPMRPDTVFWIASQTKPVTSTAFMTLFDEGKVALDTPVEEYLPEFAGQWMIAEQDEEHRLLKKPAHRITVREILSHTSGLAFRSPMESPTLDRLPLRDAVLGYAALPLQFEPGTRYLYSNEGINTAARIVETVSGLSYEDFLSERILDPLGMSETTFHPDDSLVARLATTYRPTSEMDPTLVASPTHFLYFPLTDPNRYPMPAGGLFSTARDCARFGRMILNGGELDGKRYISAEAIRLMTIKQTPEIVPESHGLGWNVVIPETVFGHGGALSTNLSIDRKNGLVTVYLVQHSGFPGEGGKCGAAFREAAVAAFGG